jgi:hypothetical protein
MNSGVYLTVKDLMLLNGSDSYRSTAKEHQAIRDSLFNDRQQKYRHRNKRKLTIREYCDYMMLEFHEIWRYLRGEIKPPDEA